MQSISKVNLDLSGTPLVTVTVDVNRLEALITVLAGAINKVVEVTNAVSADVALVNSRTIALTSDLDKTKKLLESYEIDALIQKTSGLAKDMSLAQDNVKGLQRTAVLLDERLKIQEAREIPDISALERKVDSHNIEINRLGDVMSSLQTETKMINKNLKSTDDRVTETVVNLDRMYAIWEFTPKDIAKLTGAGGEKRRNSMTPMQFLQKLPIFENMTGQVKGWISDSVKELPTIKAEVMQVRGALAAKVDVQNFNVLKGEVEGQASQVTSLGKRVDSTVRAIDGKANAMEVESAVEELRVGKADKSDLMKFALQTDVDHFMTNVKHTMDKAQSVMSSVDLSLRDNKRYDMDKSGGGGGGNGSGTTAQGGGGGGGANDGNNNKMRRDSAQALQAALLASASNGSSGGGGIDPSILTHLAQRLSSHDNALDMKANKEDLNALYQYVEKLFSTAGGGGSGSVTKKVPYPVSPGDPSAEMIGSMNRVGSPIPAPTVPQSPTTLVGGVVAQPGGVRRAAPRAHTPTQRPGTTASAYMGPPMASIVRTHEIVSFQTEHTIIPLSHLPTSGNGRRSSVVTTVDADGGTVSSCGLLPTNNENGEHWANVARLHQGANQLTPFVPVVHVTTLPQL